MKTPMDDWQRGEQIRHIAGQVFQHFKEDQKEEAIHNLVEFATLINSKDMSSFSRIDDTKEVKAEIKILESNFDTELEKLNAKIDKVEANLNARIDKVEAKIEKLDAKIDQVETNLKVEMKAIVAESQLSTIKWIAGMIIAQSTGMVFLFLKLSGKF